MQAILCRVHNRIIEMEGEEQGSRELEEYLTWLCSITIYECSVRDFNDDWIEHDLEQKISPGQE